MRISPAEPQGPSSASNRLLRVFLPISGFLAIFAAWTALALLPAFPRENFPAPATFITELLSHDKLQTCRSEGSSSAPTPNATFIDHARTLVRGGGCLTTFWWRSAERVLVGMLIGVATAIPVGLLLALSRPLDQAFGPVVMFLASLSPVAWIPIATLLLFPPAKTLVDSEFGDQALAVLGAQVNYRVGLYPRAAFNKDVIDTAVTVRRRLGAKCARRIARGVVERRFQGVERGALLNCVQIASHDDWATGVLLHTPSWVATTCIWSIQRAKARARSGHGAKLRAWPTFAFRRFCVPIRIPEGRGARRPASLRRERLECPVTNGSTLAVVGAGCLGAGSVNRCSS